MTIMTLLNQIKNGDIVLPAIQRDFVWDEGRIEMLLDSIMRGYPVGIVLLWETYEPIQYRKFEATYSGEKKQKFSDNLRKNRLKVVLDGQQRLQSLFVALYGKYKGRTLYFDVLSGRDRDDSGEIKYVFKFGTTTQANQWNDRSQKQISRPRDKRDDNHQLQHFVATERIFQMTAKESQIYRRDLEKSLGLDEDDRLRVERNFLQFDQVLTKDENILRASVIDENKPSESPERKTESDVLEIFVRINRQGMPLSRSDLIFSMLKLNWKESAEALPEFVESVNKGNSFELDTDFVIRCLFAVSDLGTRFDLELLRNKANVQTMQDNFVPCCDAIRSTIDFVKDNCWCASSRIIGGSATLIPFVYYFFHLPKHQIPSRYVDDARKALYLLGFTLPFSRYADSRLGSFIRWELKPLVEKRDWAFPLNSVIYYLDHWEGITSFGEALFRKNPALALHLIQKHSGGRAQYKNNSPELDHIFPRSVLRNKHYSPAAIDHFANFWILAKEKNQNKSNKPPKVYFREEKVSAQDLKRALIPTNLLEYRKYRTFLKKRSQAILKAVERTLDLSAADFERAWKSE